MKKILVLFLFALLVGCSQQEEDCLGSFCVDSLSYGIEGSLSVSDIDRGSVSFHSSITDDDHHLRNVEIEVFTNEWDFIANDSGQHLISSSNGVSFRGLKPSTDYIAVMRGTIVVDGEFLDIGIAYTEFTTEDFSPVEVSGLIDNIRVGTSFVVFDFEVSSNDNYIVSYGVFLYEGETKVDEITGWGSRNLVSVEEVNQVFADLKSNTTYTLKLDVIYELETNQSGASIDEIIFTTD